jgi:hypothetical protein
MPSDPLAKLAAAVDAIETALDADPVDIASIETQVERIGLWMGMVPDSETGEISARFPRLDHLLAASRRLLDRHRRRQDNPQGGPLNVGLVSF